MHQHDDDKRPIAMSREELKALASRVASEMRAAGAKASPGVAGGGSRQRGLPEELRTRFIDVRAALFQRGVFDGMLVRFDSATATPASTAELADRLEAVAQNV